MVECALCGRKVRRSYLRQHQGTARCSTARSSRRLRGAGWIPYGEALRCIEKVVGFVKPSPPIFLAEPLELAEIFYNTAFSPRILFWWAVAEALAPCRRLFRTVYIYGGAFASWGYTDTEWWIPDVAVRAVITLLRDAGVLPITEDAPSAVFRIRCATFATNARKLLADGLTIEGEKYTASDDVVALAIMATLEGGKR